MKIINRTDLSYSTLGIVIDEILKEQEHETIYFGKIAYFNFEKVNKKYRGIIRYLKRDVVWIFEEV